tara:strand:- start:223 stop:795 length:573 start_codon:yes stop_codon:yes gene_type:complete
MSNATKDQTVQLLETNGNAVVNFILDNNPAGVQSQMDSIGLLPSSMPNPSREDLKALLNDLVVLGTQEASETFKYVLEVEYSNGETNYTGGYQDILEMGIENRSITGDQSKDGEGSAWLGIVNGVLGVANGVFGWLIAQEGTEATANLAEAGRYDVMRNTVFGIPREIVVAMIVVIGVVAVVLIFKTSKK